MIVLMPDPGVFLKDSRGATSIEYGLIAAGIALAIAATVFFLGDSLESLYETISGSVATALANMGG